MSAAVSKRYFCFGNRVRLWRRWGVLADPRQVTLTYAVNSKRELAEKVD